VNQYFCSDLLKLPLQGHGHNLGALSLHLDYFDLLAGLALTVICSVFFAMRVSVGRQHLLARWPGSNPFLFTDPPGQIKFSVVFSRWPLG